MRSTVDTIMGMPITLEIVDSHANATTFNETFDYFRWVDEVFSPFKPTSELSRINQGLISPEDYSKEMATIMTLAAQSERDSRGYFSIGSVGACDPSGIVKGWAIHEAAKQLQQQGYRNFYLDVGGDIHAEGHNQEGNPWRVGIRHPFQHRKMVKVVQLSNAAVATSGTYERGHHIYNPKTGLPVTDVVSLTVIGSNIFDADRFATAAFAMGKRGIAFIEQLPDLEGCLIDVQGIAFFTSGWRKYEVRD